MKIWGFTSIVVIFLSLSSFKSSAADICTPIEGTDVYFINGMRTSIGDARIKKNQVQAILPDFSVYRATVTSNGTIRDLLEAASQKRHMDSYPELSEMRSSEVLSAAVEWLLDKGSATSDTEISEYMQSAFTEEYVDSMEHLGNVTQQEDFLNHIALYRASLNSNRNILLIGFSQGTLYSSFAYQYLVSLDARFEKRISIVDAGSVSEGHYVMDELISKGLGTYTTYNNDLVAGAVRTAYTSTLPSNYIRSRDIGHNHHFEGYFGGYFIPNNTYEEDKNEVEHFLANVYSVLGNLDTETCIEEPEPEPEPENIVRCGTPINQSGGYEGLFTTVNLGTQPGEVTIQFDAFSIPDRLSIYDQAGRLLYATDGFVSGVLEATFYHTGSEANQYVTIDVKTASENTLWSLSVGCPDRSSIGDGRSSNSKPSLKLRVNHFIFHEDPDGYCKTEVWLDGSSIFREYSETSAIYNKSVDVSYGTHIIEHKSECGCDKAFGCGSRIKSGTYSISSKPNEVFDLPVLCIFCSRERFTIEPPAGQQALKNIELAKLHQDALDREEVAMDFESGIKWSVTSGNSWIINTGNTPSSATGPEAASQGVRYAYFETSSGYAYKSGDQAILESEYFTGLGGVLLFSYHMYGLDSGSLYLEVFNGNAWITIWSRTGQQNSSGASDWNNEQLSLDAYDGGIKLRFRAEAIGGYRGDIAIDNIRVDTSVPTPPPLITDMLIEFDGSDEGDMLLETKLHGGQPDLTLNSDDGVKAKVSWEIPSNARVRIEFLDGSWNLLNVTDRGAQSATICLKYDHPGGYCEALPSFVRGRMRYRFRVEIDGSVGEWQYARTLDVVYRT